MSPPPPPQPPIGTIVAFAGTGPTSSGTAWEQRTGWMVCDGRPLNRTTPSYSALFNEIGSSWGGDGAQMFNLPDLQGFFLRGVDNTANRDPDHDNRSQINRGAHQGNQVGSIQSFATALPHNPNFKAASNGDHSHEMPFETTATRAVNPSINNTVTSTPVLPLPRTGVGGAHEHAIVNGDLETRPKNAYVHWIIRFR